MKEYHDAEYEEETVTLTRAEIDALTRVNDLVRAETIRQIFNDVEELLSNRARLEWGRSHNLEASFTTRLRRRYAMNVCETLIKKLKKIEKKYTEEGK